VCPKRRQRLVDDWRECWRWISMQAMAIALALQGAWMAVPEDLRANLPSWLITAVTIVLLVLGMIGRLLTQQPRQSRR
jgi:hypothetical protein